MAFRSSSLLLVSNAMLVIAPNFKANVWIQPRGARRTCDLLERLLPHVGCNPLQAHITSRPRLTLERFDRHGDLTSAQFSFTPRSPR